MNKKKKIIIIVISTLLVIIAIAAGSYFFSLSAVSDTTEVVEFTVNQGDSKEVVAENLKNAKLIRSKYATLVYILISGKNNIQAGDYKLSRNMTTQEIINVLATGEIADDERPTTMITFKEGIRLEDYMALLAEKTNLEYDTIINEVNDKEFLQTLINDYWFLTDDILNDELYYGLEGYLYPNTYEFYVDTTLDTAIRKMLNETDKRLSNLKSKIEASSYSVHDILTMASIVEKEAVHVEDRAKVAQVIYTRMDLGMNLGMDVTTYYGVRKDMTETLTTVDLNDENPYNTRVATFLGLPVGPICNPAISSIESVLNPADTDYIYFYADIITGNVYFTNSYDEFLEFRKIYG